MYFFVWKILYSYVCIKKQFTCISEYIIKCLILLNRVHIVIEKYTAGCQQTFCWWQPVVSRHFASDNRLSADLANKKSIFLLTNITNSYLETWPRGYKTFSCSTEHKISTAHKTKIRTNKEVSCFKSLGCCIYHVNKC